MQSEWLQLAHILACAGTSKQREKTRLVKKIYVYEVTFFFFFFFFKQANKYDHSHLPTHHLSIHSFVLPSIHLRIHPFNNYTMCSLS